MVFKYAESTVEPAKIEKSGTTYYIRKNIVLNEATEERPAMYSYDEAKATADEVIVYQEQQLLVVHEEQELQNEVLDTLLMK